MTRSRRTARDAGTRFETLVAAYLADRWDDRIERRTRGGVKDRGDISGFRHQSQRVVIECKNTNRAELSAWWAEAELERGKLTVDHVVPVALGGSDDPSNLVAACHDCNMGKGSTGPDENTVAQVSEDALRWAAAKAAAFEAMRVEHRQTDADVERFHDEWTNWDKSGVCLPNDWESSIRQWLKAGLSVDDLTSAYAIALGSPAKGRDVFRYMAGVVRNWIREAHERADAAIREA